MPKRTEQNPFDEKSQSNRKGHNKEQKPKFSLKDFKKLPKEEQIKIAKEQINSEEGFAHPYILDIYNEYIVGDDANGNTEKKVQNNKNEIKDLSQLATFKGDFPESAPVNEKAQEIEDKQKKNAEARKTATKKAGNLDPEKGEDAMQNALAGVVKKEETIIVTTQKQVDNAIASDEVATTNTTETKQPTKAEMLAQLQEIQKRQKEKAEQIAILEEENSKLAKKNKVTSQEPKDNSSEKSDQKEEKEIEKIKNTEDASLEDEEELLQPIDLEDDGIVKPINLEDDESKNSKEIKQKVNNKTLEISKVRELVDIKIGSVSAAEGRELTIQEQADITREIYLQELEAFNKAKAEKMGIFKKALIKTENWWLGIDNDGNKVEQSLTSRAGKVALATAITSVGAFMTGDVSRLISRVGYATGISTVINTALTSNKVQEILKRKSKTKTENTEEEEDKKLIQKIFNKKKTNQGIISGAAICTTFMLSGGIMAIVTGGGIICRKLINHYIDEKTNKIRNRPKDEILIENDFDINTFINELNLHEQSEIKFAKFIKNGERIKSLLNTSLSIGIGITSLEVGLHKEIANETLEVKSVENHVNNEEGNISEETTGKSWWGKALDKIKSFSQGDTDQETTKVDQTLLDNQKPILEDTRAEGDKIDLKKINEKIINTNQTDNSIQEPVQEEKELETEHSQKPETNTENTTTEETTVEKSNVTEEETKVNNPPEAQDSSKLNKVQIDENKKPIVSEESNNETEETNTTEQDKASEVEPIENTEKVTGDKVDIKTIKPESIIDSQKNVGETYVYRSLIREDNELAEKLAKYQGLNLDKVDDDRYMANYLKKLAIKLGRMDDEGHEIRYNQKAVDNISLKLDVDKDGKLVSYEIDKEGIIKDVHHEGDQFEKDLEDYEETKLQKTYSKIDEAYEKNGGLVKPEKVVPALGDPFSGSYFNGDDNQEYLENQAKNNARITPDSLQEEEIVAPEKINNTYKLENIANYKDWDKIKDLSLKTFLERSQYSDMYGEEGKQLMVSLKGINEKVLEFVDNDEEFNKFILSNPDLTVEEATNLYKNITEEQSFTDELKEKYGFYDWKDRLAENIKLNEKEIKELKAFKDVMNGDNEVKKIFKLNYGKKIFDNENDFLNNKEVRAIYSEYNKNIKALDKKMFDDLTQTIKNNTVNNYLEKNENILTDYLTEVREKLGDLAKPQWNLGAGEKIDEYLKRITALAKIKRINIDPKLILKQEDINKPELDEIEKYRPSSSFKEDTGNLSKIKNDEFKEYKPNEEGTSDNEYRSFKQDAKKGDTEDYSKYKPYNKK